jgi:hypothetical protein
MGGANQMGSVQKAKLKIKYDFVVNFFNLNLSTYLFKLDLWLSGLGLT